MELTYDIVQAMIRERIDKHSTLQRLVTEPAFDQTLQEILDFENINPALFERIRFNLLIVLTIYAPLNELASNISEDTGLTNEQSKTLVQTIKAVLLPADILEELIYAQIYWAENKQDESEDAPADGRIAAFRSSLEGRTPTQDWKNQTVERTLPFTQQAPAATVPDADNAIRDELLLKPRMTEKIVNRAVPQPGAKPLTREDILQSLAAKRTLASDVSALQQNGE